jgi:hypothetical protein
MHGVVLLFQLWLTKFARATSIDHLGSELIRINNEYEQAKAKEKKNAPSKGDAEENVDDMAADNSVGYFIMDSLSKVLSALLRVGDAYRPQTAFSDVDEKGENLLTFPRSRHAALVCE